MKEGGGDGSVCLFVFTEFVALLPLEKKHHSRVDYGGQGYWGEKVFSINQKLGEFLKHHRRINAAKTGFQVLVVLLFLLVGCQQRSSAGTASYFTVVAHIKSNGDWTTSLLLHMPTPSIS